MRRYTPVLPRKPSSPCTNMVFHTPAARIRCIARPTTCLMNCRNRHARCAHRLDCNWSVSSAVCKNAKNRAYPSRPPARKPAVTTATSANTSDNAAPTSAPITSAIVANRQSSDTSTPIPGSTIRLCHIAWPMQTQTRYMCKYRMSVPSCQLRPCCRSKTSPATT